MVKCPQCKGARYLYSPVEGGGRRDCPICDGVGEVTEEYILKALILVPQLKREKEDLMSKVAVYRERLATFTEMSDLCNKDQGLVEED